MSGKVKLLLRNDSIMTLSEKSEIHITEFLLNDQRHRSIISLVVGKVRVLTTKLFGQADAMEVKTPNTVAGIRSSEKHVEYDDQIDETRVICVSGHCYVRHHEDPDKHIRIPEGHITEHAGDQFPSATRRAAHHEIHRSMSALSITAHTAHDPRELTTEPESPEDVKRPPRRAPHEREEGERGDRPERERGDRPPPGEEPPPPGEEPRGEEPPPGEEPPLPPGDGPPPLPDDGLPPWPGEDSPRGERSPLIGDEPPPPPGEERPPPGEEPPPIGEGPLPAFGEEPEGPGDELPPPPPPPPPGEVITPDTSPARPTSIIRLLIRIPPSPNEP